jgi:hypothetical protein
MTSILLLKRLSDQGVSVLLDGVDLLVRGPTKVITPEVTDELRKNKPQLIAALTSESDKSSVQQVVHETQSKRLVAECRSKAVKLQTWLTDHTDEHMRTEPFGMPEWISALAEFDYVERNQLRRRFQFQGCIHGGKSCPDEAPVSCTACEGHDE